MAQQPQRTSKGRTILGVLIVLAAAGAFTWAVWPDRNPQPTQASLVDAVSANDWQRGKAGSAVSLVEYGDVQCPSCAAVQPIVDQVVKRYGDRVNFVYRHFPLTEIHQNAEIGAIAAEAAGRQGKLFEMLDALFSQQTSWSNLPDADARAKFVQFAKDLKLDATRFEKDLSSDEVRAAVDADRASGDRAGVSGTPTFFLSGKVVASIPRSVDDFAKLLDAALAAKQPTTSK